MPPPGQRTGRPVAGGFGNKKPGHKAPRKEHTLIKKSDDKPAFRKGGRHGNRQQSAFGDDNQSRASRKIKFFVPMDIPWHMALAEAEADYQAPVSSACMSPEHSLARAEKLLNDQTLAFQDNRLLGVSDQNWISTVLQSGTSADKISALVVLVQESPIMQLRYLRQLVAMSRKMTTREAMAACAALKELFIDTLLPERKLVFFEQRRIFQSTPDLVVLLWHFEDLLKKEYLSFLAGIEQLSHHNQATTRSRMVTFNYELLNLKPEQEQLLLKLLANKLGDSDNKIASKASRQLNLLLNNHPNMKTIVNRHIEEVLFRPNVGDRAQYYCIITMNQTILTARDSDLANHLINIYFTLFKQMMDAHATAEREKFSKRRRAKHFGRKRKAPQSLSESAEDEELDSKMLSALLSGINRALPFSKLDEDVFQGHMNTLFLIVHKGNFNTAVQSLVLIFQVASTRQNDLLDRYYRTLYAVLLDPRLATSSKLAMLMNLVHRSLLADASIDRTAAFIKRLLQVSLSEFWLPGFCCAVLYLVSDLIKRKPQIYLLATAMPADRQEQLQSIQASGSKRAAKKAEAAAAAKKDADADADNTAQAMTETEAEADNKSAEGEAKAETTDEATDAESTHAGAYDPRKRNPSYAGAEHSCLHDLVPLSHHYHPSVSKLATQLLRGQALTMPTAAADASAPDAVVQTLSVGDSVHEHSLIRFLDRFVYRNPKAIKDEDGLRLRGSDSIMQPNRQLYTSNLLPEDFARLAEDDIPEDQLFFYQFFKKKAEQDAKLGAKKPKKPSADDDDDDDDGDLMGEDVDDSVFEDMLKSGLLEDDDDDD
ncbi:hypothetical protein H696_00282, partial [Fonticula alba]